MEAVAHYGVAPQFSEAERAAWRSRRLTGFAEAEGGFAPEILARARCHLDEDQIVSLVATVATEHFFDPVTGRRRSGRRRGGRPEFRPGLDWRTAGEPRRLSAGGAGSFRGGVSVPYFRSARPSDAGGHRHRSDPHPAHRRQPAPRPAAPGSAGGSGPRRLRAAALRADPRAGTRRGARAPLGPRVRHRAARSVAARSPGARRPGPHPRAPRGCAGHRAHGARGRRAGHPVAAGRGPGLPAERQDLRASWWRAPSAPPCTSPICRRRCAACRSSTG